MARNNVGKQPRLDERRREFYRLRISGKRLDETIKIISQKYKVKPGALYKDWKDRQTWGEYVIFEDDDKFLVQDILNRLDEFEARLKEIADDERSTPEQRIRAYSKLYDGTLKKLEALQSLGKVHIEPVKVRIEEEVQRLNAIVAEVAGDDQIAQENLMRVILRYAESESSEN